MRILALVLLALAIRTAAQDEKAVFERAEHEASLELLFRDPKPPIKRLVLESLGAGEQDGRKTISYTATAEGLPRDKSYILMSWDIGTRAPIIALDDIRLSEHGTLQCGERTQCPGSKPGASLILTVSGMLGQPRRFVLTGNDKQPVAMGEVVPFPARGSDNGCSAEAVILVPNAAITLLIGEGFSPGEVVKQRSSSRGEVIDREFQASPNGRVLTAVLPYVKGFDDGETQFTFQGSRCRPATAFRWGPYREERAETSTSAK
jgi:hypothetical protein